jgi:cell division transport system permease protein
MSNVWASFITTLKGMKRNITMTLASLILVVLTMSVVSFIFVLSINTNYMVKQTVDNLKISVFLDKTLTAEQEVSIAQEILKVDKVADAKLSKKDDELKEVTQLMGEEGSTIYQFFAQENPLSSVYEVTIENSDTQEIDFEVIAKDIEKIEGIEDAKYGDEDATATFVGTMRTIQFVSSFVAAVLVIASVFIISNTIKLNITSRKKEVEIMRLVGATKMFIRLPFLLEGFTIGLIGGIISCLLFVPTYSMAMSTEFLSLLSSSLIPFNTTATAVIVTVPISGMLVGGIASMFAIRKYLQT